VAAARASEQAVLHHLFFHADKTDQLPQAAGVFLDMVAFRRIGQPVVDWGRTGARALR